VYSKSKIKYMKGFFFINFIYLAISINSILGAYYSFYSRELCFSIQSFLLLSDLRFWALFFLKLLPDKKSKRIIGILFTISLLFSLLILYYNNTDKSNLQILVVLNICKTIFCIRFYHTLFKNLTSQNILLEPAFWIINGLIFYSCLSLPFYGLNDYIKQQFSSLISNNIFSISNMLIIIMFFFFIKAYLCKTPQHKVS
jgi:hypothetical protein